MSCERARASPPKAVTERGSSGHRLRKHRWVEAERERGAVEEETQVGRHCGLQSVGGPCSEGSSLAKDSSEHPEGDSLFGEGAGRVKGQESGKGRETTSAHQALANAAEATVVERRHGCQRGESFEGCERAVGNGRVGARRSSDHRVLPSLKHSESCSAVGCNKPTTGSEAQTVEVVRNHEDGTRRTLAVFDASQGMEPLTGEGPATRMPPRPLGRRG
jgi:hypothetical protein